MPWPVANKSWGYWLVGIRTVVGNSIGFRIVLAATGVAVVGYIGLIYGRNDFAAGCLIVATLLLTYGSAIGLILEK